MRGEKEKREWRGQDGEMKGEIEEKVRKGRKGERGKIKGGKDTEEWRGKERWRGEMSSLGLFLTYKHQNNHKVTGLSGLDQAGPIGPLY